MFTIDRWLDGIRFRLIVAKIKDELRKRKRFVSLALALKLEAYMRRLEDPHWLEAADDDAIAQTMAGVLRGLDAVLALSPNAMEESNA